MDERIRPQHTATGEVIQLYSKATGRGMALMYFLFFLFMLFMSLCLLAVIPAYIDQYEPLLLVTVIPIAIVFYLFLLSSLYCNMVFAYKFAGKPVLVFNNQGIIDNTRIFPIGVIRWEEITEILPCEFATSSGATRRLVKEKGIGIRLRDKMDFMSRFGFLTRTMIRLNSWPGYFIVKSRELDLGTTDIFKLIDMLGNTFHVEVGEFRKAGDGK